MEIQIKTITAYDKNCFGCKHHNKDVMIAFKKVGESATDSFTDLFLTQAQAESLFDQLGDAINRNKEPQ